MSGCPCDACVSDLPLRYEFLRRRARAWKRLAKDWKSIAEDYLKERDYAFERLAEVQAQAAAMHAIAISVFDWNGQGYECPSCGFGAKGSGAGYFRTRGEVEHSKDCHLAMALAPDAGKALLARLKKLEAVAEAARFLVAHIFEVRPKWSEGLLDALRALDEETKP